MNFPKFSVLLILSWGIMAQANAQCTDNVVLVHGNTASPDSWDNTAAQLLATGYTQDQIFIPSWGSKTNASINDHNGSEETPVRNAISSAISQSCSGKIDVIAHSMGVTLAAQQIIKLGSDDKVDAFVGIAGAYRGLLSCGYYPWNVWTKACGYYGLSVSNPFLDWLYGKPIANRVYSIKSWVDQVVCFGSCLVFGVHSSSIANEDQSYTIGYGHLGLQTYTYELQVSLLN